MIAPNHFSILCRAKRPIDSLKMANLVIPMLNSAGSMLRPLDSAATQTIDRDPIQTTVEGATITSADQMLLEIVTILITRTRLRTAPTDPNNTTIIKQPRGEFLFLWGISTMTTEAHNTSKGKITKRKAFIGKSNCPKWIQTQKYT